MVITTKRRLFVDMDGVLAVFHPEKSIEEIAEPGYFRNLEPMNEVVDAIKRLITEDKYDVYILSSVLNDIAAGEKWGWLMDNLKNIEADHILFVPYGVDKSTYVRDQTGALSTDDVLLDDFTYNLKKWHGIGVKLLNKINNTNRSWTGYVVNGQASPAIICNTLNGIDMVA